MSTGWPVSVLQIKAVRLQSKENISTTIPVFPLCKSTSIASLAFQPLSIRMFQHISTTLHYFYFDLPTATSVGQERTHYRGLHSSRIYKPQRHLQISMLKAIEVALVVMFIERISRPRTILSSVEISINSENLWKCCSLIALWSQNESEHFTSSKIS